MSVILPVDVDWSSQGVCTAVDDSGNSVTALGLHGSLTACVARYFKRAFWRGLVEQPAIKFKWVTTYTSTKIPPTKGDRLVVQLEGLKKSQKVAKVDDVMSTITGDSLIIFRKKFHFPNDLVMKVLAKFIRVYSPPQGFLIILRTGLQFSPPPELIDILTTYGVSLS
ncbi:hypothetical protein IEQ34_013449 [Dendrobium chrysotoxum]|uniref:Uncharacterized protein n=1 Tax=Dendrobium chrysotoxum TaxID=161865 RepID=A0AAV7GRP7_DENCH|nr:hypothetical protein IEQ34_013449 [Dendrobium chrysotoxum]